MPVFTDNELRPAQPKIDARPITTVVVSDLHIGSSYALMPEEWQLVGSRHVVRPSAYQLFLLEAWMTTVRNWKNPDILIVLGDAIDGQQPAERGVTTWTTSVYDQVLASKALLQMFDAKHVFVVQGTRYHVTLNGLAVEELLARELNADFYTDEHRQAGIRSDKELWLRIGGVTFHFSHHVSTSAIRQSQLSILARELTMLLLRRMETTEEALDTYVDVRGHIHAYYHVEVANQHAFTTPCWQLQTSYMAEKSPLGLVPDVGALRFTIDDNNFGYEKLLFPTAKPRPTEVSAL